MTEQRPEKKVIVIPAKEETLQEQAKKRNLRVAAYCRVSTNSDEQLSSYENQKAFYTEKIMKNPDWTMTDIFADEGKTGTSTCKRKEFLRNFYLSAVDGILKKEQDNPSIGLLLCKSKNDIVAEYSLKDMSKPIGVSAYQITSNLPEELERQLPSVEDIQKRIKGAKE